MRRTLFEKKPLAELSDADIKGKFAQLSPKTKKKLADSLNKILTEELGK